MFGSRRIAASFIVAHRMRIQLGLLRGPHGNPAWERQSWHLSNVLPIRLAGPFQRLTGPNMLNRNLSSVTLLEIRAQSRPRVWSSRTWLSATNQLGNRTEFLSR